jgi:hypothetical protein
MSWPGNPSITVLCDFNVVVCLGAVVARHIAGLQLDGVAVVFNERVVLCNLLLCLVSLPCRGRDNDI